MSKEYNLKINIGKTKITECSRKVSALISHYRDTRFNKLKNLRTGTWEARLLKMVEVRNI